MRLIADDIGRAEALRLIGELATGLAHDLNQSLGLIAGYAELSLAQLDADQIDPGELRHSLHLMHRAAQDSATLVEHILRFARQPLDAGDEPVAALDVADLLAEVAELTAIRWRRPTQPEARPIHVHVEADPDCFVTGSRASLQHVFTNLMLNAVEAMPDGGSICLRARRLAEAVSIEVSDTGVGMSPEVQARIFEPFFTTKGARGTGLGLAQVCRAVTRHGGSIDVASTPGQGTTFRLRLPASAKR